MLNRETPFPSQPPARINGKSEVEAETDSHYPEKKEYKLEDFSQSAINRGQQKINGLVADTGEKVVDVLREVRNLIAILYANGTIDLQALDAAINKASQANNAIAGEFPPGCLYPVQTQPKPGDDGVS
jgi:hypothetical protein